MKHFLCEFLNFLDYLHVLLFFDNGIKKFKMQSRKREKSRSKNPLQLQKRLIVKFFFFLHLIRTLTLSSSWLEKMKKKSREENSTHAYTRTWKEPEYQAQESKKMIYLIGCKNYNDFLRLFSLSSDSTCSFLALCAFALR